MGGGGQGAPLDAHLVLLLTTQCKKIQLRDVVRDISLPDKIAIINKFWVKRLFVPFERKTLL